jgi:hypothetical protein
VRFWLLMLVLLLTSLALIGWATHELAASLAAA